MMTDSRQMRVRSLLLALALTALAAPLAAQKDEGLRVLRFGLPGREAGPLDPLVITFDHPVAPRLDASVNPARVLRIKPAVRTHPFWRDPSTLVVEFLDAWPFGATYHVQFDPSLRSADGS